MSLFNLTARATLREAAFLSKERRIPHTEHSPNLQLIRSSEVDPFPGAPGSSKTSNASNANSSTAQTKTTSRGSAGTNGQSHTRHAAAAASIVAARVRHAQSTSLPSQPPIVQPPELLTRGDEQLKASYRVAVTNLQNELAAAKAKAKANKALAVADATQSAKKRYVFWGTFWIALGAVLAVVGIDDLLLWTKWEIARLMGQSLESESTRAMTDGREEWETTDQVNDMLPEPRRENWGWRSWLWAQPGSRS